MVSREVDRWRWCGEDYEFASLELIVTSLSHHHHNNNHQHHNNVKITAATTYQSPLSLSRTATRTQPTSSHKHQPVPTTVQLRHKNNIMLPSNICLHKCSTVVTTIITLPQQQYHNVTHFTIHTSFSSPHYQHNLGKAIFTI